jgi:Xaa-Pro aminopeptidase
MEPMPTVPRSEIEMRVRALQERARAADPPLDALLVVQNADLYYLAGTVQTAHLLLPATGEPRLLVRKVLERARRDSPLGDIRPLGSLKELPAQLREVCGAPPWRLGMELDVLTVNLHRAYARIFGEDAEILDASPAILGARAVKSDWEVSRLREAAEIHRGLFLELGEILRGGFEGSSYELQSLLEYRARLLGHCGIIRMRGLNVETALGLVVSGRDGVVPSYSMFPIGGEGPHPWVAQGGGSRPLQRDTPIIVDFLASREGYHADCTRMAVMGRFPDGAAELLAGLRRLLRFCEESARPGAVPAEIYAAVRERAAAAGLAAGFMGPAGYQVRFIGHGVGLEVNETPVLAPRFDEPLVPGNTLAIEPKFTHPEWGVIGLENTYVVRGDGVENLTPFAEEVIG